MAETVLSRIGRRLICGQVMVKWVNLSGVNKIIVVSDNLAEDKFMLKRYLLSSSPEVTIECYSKEDTIKNWNEYNLPQAKCFSLYRI